MFRILTFALLASIATPVFAADPVTPAEMETEATKIIESFNLMVKQLRQSGLDLDASPMAVVDALNKANNEKLEFWIKDMRTLNSHIRRFVRLAAISKLRGLVTEAVRASELREIIALIKDEAELILEERNGEQLLFERQPNITPQNRL